MPLPLPPPLRGFRDGRHHRGAASASAPTVLQVVPGVEPGEAAGRSAVDVARAVAAAGWRTLVATAGGALLERDLTRAGAGLVRLPLGEAGLVASWQNARLLARAARQEGAGLLHAHGLEAAAVTADAARRAGLPFLVTVHELPEAAAGGGRAGRARDAALKGAGLVVAPSEFAAEQLTAGPLGVESSRVRVVPRWVDLEEFDPDRVRGHRVAAAAERCGLAVGPKVVAVPAEVAVGDGRLLLVEALGRLERGRDDFVLLLLGSLPTAAGRDATAKLTAGLAAAGLADRLRFGTELTDLPAALALIDVLLVPATLPRASARLPAAAQAMGKPVIVTTVGALSEAVMPAVTGWLLPPDGPGELAWAIELALRMEDDVRERVGRRAREFAAYNFSAELQLRRKLAAYRELLNPTAPARPAPAEGDEEEAVAAAG